MLKVNICSASFMKTVLCAFVGLSCFCAPLLAQQEAQFTQYMFNGLVLNPAYAGSQEAMNMTAAWRRQWINMEGAPETQMFSVHAPTRSKKVGWGGMIVNDRIGIHQNTRLFGMYAYRISTGKGTLSMGIQAGYLLQRSDYASVTTQQADPNFQGNYREAFPEFGAGLYYHTDRWYIGASVPKLTGDLFSDDPRRIENERHFYLTSGYVFRVNEVLQVHPSVLLKSIGGAALAYDLNVNTVINEVIWAGVSVRSFNAINVLLQLQTTQQLRFGYAYDTQFAGFSQIRNSSHEIIFNYLFAYKKDKVVSPRIF